jgi:hypothetical protein
VTNTLDNILLHIFVDDLGVKDELNADLYAEGYRVCDNYNDKAYQIKLVEKLLGQVVEGVRFSVGMYMRLERKPAYTVGWNE